MTKKEQIQAVYLSFRENFNMDTALCMEFLEWLHNEKNELIYLEDMEGITTFEKGYIKKLLGR